MKRLYSTLILIGLTILAHGAFSQTFHWAQRNRPMGSGETVYGFVMTAQGDILAATSRGLRRSPDQGRTWKDAGFQDETVRAIARDAAGRMFGGLIYDGIYRSDDDGKSWQPFGLTESTVSAVNFDASGKIYAGTTDGTLHRTLTENGGWQELIKAGGPIQGIALSDSGQIYLATAGAGIYRSPDAGTSWRRTQDPRLRTCYALAFVSNGRLLAAAEGLDSAGLYSSADSGKTWEAIGPPDIAFISLEADSNGTIYAGSRENGLFVSVDGGTTWQSLGPEKISVRASLRAGVDAFLIGTDNAGMWLSVDAGATWTQTGLTPYALTTLLIGAQGEIYTGTAGPHRDGVFVSRDGGVSWQITGQTLNGRMHSLLFNQAGYLFAGGDPGVLRLLHPDSMWQRVLDENQVMALAASANGRIFAASDEARIYWSDDGTQWHEGVTPEPSPRFTALFVTAAGRRPLLLSSAGGGFCCQPEAFVVEIGDSPL